MLISVEGVYRNGKVELKELPANVNNDARVIITFVEPGSIDLRSRGIDEAQASDLRALGNLCRRLEQPGDGYLRQL